jgi:hypothetical protein
MNRAGVALALVGQHRFRRRRLMQAETRALRRNDLDLRWSADVIAYCIRGRASRGANHYARISGTGRKGKIEADSPQSVDPANPSLN